ncbi:hypothetical protein WA026_004502 [Henosepilachna vigintioctopunctata]|uniref:Uncharacterized protein n=1 Tax=Henosepilachna vigintioctopunctata TaxID=420089 RepID=A0AAW1V7U3_9CUCU
MQSNANFLNTTETYKKLLEENLEKIADDTQKLSKILPEFVMVCDGHGDPCDSICRGAGCSSCGSSISCEDGAKQQAETAVSLANNTEISLRNKEGIINNFIRNVKRKINVSTPETIKKLAYDIRRKVDSLTNTEAIIEATRADLIKVNLLKGAAAEASMKAGNLSSDANDVKKALENSTNAQRDAEVAINKALDHTSEVNKLLKQITEKTDSAQNKTESTADVIKKLAGKLDDLQQNITNNGIYANRVKNETATILRNAEKAYEDFNSLHAKYDTAKRKLSGNINNVTSLKEKADMLFQNVVTLLAHITKTDEAINKLEAIPQKDPVLLENQLEMLIRRANNSTLQIEKRIKYYKNCN